MKKLINYVLSFFAFLRNSNGQTIEINYPLGQPNPVTVILNKKINVFEGSIEWDHAQVEITIEVGKEDEITDEFETLKKLLSNQSKWKERIDNYAVQELLPLKNESWLDEGEKDWTPEQFIETIILESIWINKNGGFQFWHGDGDIFWGHSILIEGSISTGPNYADIPG